MYISHKWSNVILINKFIVNVTFFSLHLCGSFCMKNKWYTFYSSVWMFFFLQILIWLISKNDCVALAVRYTGNGNLRMHCICVTVVEVLKLSWSVLFYMGAQYIPAPLKEQSAPTGSKHVPYIEWLYTVHISTPERACLYPMGCKFVSQGCWYRDKGLYP